jgi:protease II
MKAYKYEKDNQIFIMYDINSIPEGVTYEEIDFVDNTNQLQKEQQILEYKQMQYKELLATDWYFVRKSELGTDVPQEILDIRASIREKYNNLINEIK